MGFAFIEGLDHASIIATSEKVAWTVDGVFRDRSFDASKAIVPPSWVGTEALGFLDAGEQLVLNHCRAFSYVHLLGNYEEFIPCHLNEIVAPGRAERARLRATLRFGEEELKHQELFRRAERLLEESCGHPFARHFDDGETRVAALSEAILDHPALPRCLILLALEWGTQRHYVESILNCADEGGDPLYVDVLRAHWVEEAQHTKSDTLEIGLLARGRSAPELREAFDDVLSIGGLVDATFAGQADREIETFQEVTGRALSGAEAAALRDALYRSLQAIVAGISLSHPRFAKVARELSPEGAARLGIA